jgi:hypothetical protein
MMFDDVFGMAEQCAETFRNGVNDAFGSSIVADVLDPIRHEIGLLRSFHEEFQRQSLNLEQILQEARSFHLNEGCN